MKVQLVKCETKETFGKGEQSFDYWHRPLTVEEKQNINSHIVWKTVKRKGKPDTTDIDYAATDLSELLRLAVTRIDRFEGFDKDGNKYEIDTIDKLLEASFDAGVVDGVMLSMWVTIWLATNLSEELKKKLSQDSTPGATE